MENEENTNSGSKNNDKQQIEQLAKKKENQGILLIIFGIILFLYPYIFKESQIPCLDILWGASIFAGIYKILESNKLKKDMQPFVIQGWLVLFLSLVTGFVCGTIKIGIILYAEYPELTLFRETCTNILTNVAFPIYVIVLFLKVKPNAVFIGKAYLILKIIPYLLMYILDLPINTISFVIDGCFGIIWFAYLTFSEQVKILFPVKKRITYKRDIVVIGITFLIIITPYIIYFNNGYSETSENDYSYNIEDNNIDAFLLDSSNELSLNEIRFANWTNEDWNNNDYFRFLRKCFDECNKGIKNENTHSLQSYKSVLSNQFFVYKSEPYISGGLFITIGFLNEPEMLYNTAIYSYVDKETGKITGYTLLGFQKSEEASLLTKEEIIEIQREHPENKFW